ncbi:IS3 family transposase [Ruminococcus difficilis]|uniref:IS3 family transposase n=1 Tax=Ruminococcus difficilis TaxID=2763069 RepID=A0A935C4L1_9FIRM|nr:IS3 family transposase [Ruminococcus difficilis]MBK6090316.1 IS3 family transposase [Ruminococcus difficilis]
MKKISFETKESIINRYFNGESVAELTEATGVARSTIYGWLKASQSESENKPVNKKTVNDLERKIIRLSTIIEIMQKVFDVENIPTQIRLEELERLYGEYNVHNLCDALMVPRGTFYNHIKRNKRDNAWYAKRRESLREEIQKIYYDKHQIYGSPKIAATLRSRGIKITEGMVRQLMQDMGLISIREGAKDYYDKEKSKNKNYLNQKFNTTRPNEVWVSDITCFRYNEKYYYICVIVDLCARKVVGYKIGGKNSTQLTKSTFKLAYESRQPDENLIFHTDNGSNYTSKSFRDYLKKLRVTQSFSRPHIPYDNSVMESFFSNMKREELYRTKYRSEKEFRTAVKNYIQFYNEERPHSKNKYKTPSQKEAEYFSKQAENGD